MPLLPHLGQILFDARKAQRPKLTREKIAAEAGCGIDKVRNLEEGKAWPRSPADADVMVNAYAKLTGGEPLPMWESSLKLWREHDEATTQVADETPAAAPLPGPVGAKGRQVREHRPNRAGLQPPLADEREPDSPTGTDG